MLWTLASRILSLSIALVHIAGKIIIKIEGIPHGLGGTDYSREGAIEVPTMSVCVVSVYPSISIASVVSAYPLCLIISDSIFVAL